MFRKTYTVHIYYQRSRNVTQDDSYISHPPYILASLWAIV